MKGSFHVPQVSRQQAFVMLGGARGGGYLLDLLGSYDLAWKIGGFVGLVADTLQLLMNDRPTGRMQALQAV